MVIPMSKPKVARQKRKPRPKPSKATPVSPIQVDLGSYDPHTAAIFPGDNSALYGLTRGMHVCPSCGHHTTERPEGRIGVTRLLIAVMRDIRKNGVRDVEFGESCLIGSILGVCGDCSEALVASGKLGASGVYRHAHSSPNTVLG